MNKEVIYDCFDIEDKDIVKRIKSNDRDLIEQAYEDLYNKYSKLAFVCINNIVKNYSDSEDLLADTFLKVFENRDSLIEEKNLKYYIVTTAKNTSLNFVMKKRLETVNVDDMFLEDIEDADSNINEMIDVMKQYLNDIEMKIVLNHLIYALTFEEIGSHMNLSSNTVKTTYYRALKKVK